MSSEFVTLYLALLALVAQLGVVVLLFLWLGGGVSARIRRWRAAAVELVGPAGLLVASAVAVVATMGSLYFSEVADFVPCKLCWYQRIAMYPLVPVLVVAAWRRDWRVTPYVALVAVIGGAISTYHVLLERFPSLEGSATCDPANPCSLKWVERFGYMTIPTMALSGFALITALAFVARRWAILKGGAG